MSDQVDYTVTKSEGDGSRSRIWWVLLIVVLLVVLCCCAAVLIMYFWVGDILLQIFRDISSQLELRYY